MDLLKTIYHWNIMSENIPKEEVKSVIGSILKHISFPETQIIEMQLLIDTIIIQNYFEHNSTYYMQSDGLAMGAPASSFLSEIFIQYLEHNYILRTLRKHNTVYYRYVGDILIVYNCENTHINATRLQYNSLRRKLQFTIENEYNSRLNFLDLIIDRAQDHLQFGIYRKPTATDILINGNSCHPVEHEMSGVKYLINRLITYPITGHNKVAKVKTIEQMLKVNNYGDLNVQN
jgi:hypothetical protein